jgi:error-prone DNA polymerase
VFLQIKGFSEYGFPESHAASFALLAYASSYMKCHYPAEFNAALVNSQPMGFYSSHTLIEEAKRSGVKILPVDINRSGWDCEIIYDGGEKPSIRIGLRVVRGMNEEAARALIRTRQELPFQSLMDFLSRTRLSPQALLSLAMGEAFSCFGLDQRQSLWEILAYRMLTKPSASDVSLNGGNGGGKLEDGKLNQMNLFEDLRSSSQTNIKALVSDQDDVSFKKLSDYQAIRTDYQVYGLSTRGHPMKELRQYFSKKVPSLTTGAVRNAQVGRVLRIAGLTIVRQRPPNAKGTCFGTLEDEEGFLDLILHEDIFEKYHDVFVNEPFIIATGKVQRDLKATSLLVTKIEAVTEVTGSDEATLVVKSKDFG